MYLYLISLNDEQVNFKFNNINCGFYFFKLTASILDHLVQIKLVQKLIIKKIKLNLV